MIDGVREEKREGREKKTVSFNLYYRLVTYYDVTTRRPAEDSLLTVIISLPVVVL